MAFAANREPPTAQRVARDLSGSKKRASAAPDRRRRSIARVCLGCGCFPCRCGTPVSEVRHDLIRSCVCGGWVRATTPLPADILFAVQTHNQTERHAEWRRINGR